MYTFHKFFDGILGNQTLQENCSVIDYRKKEVSINGQKFRIYFEGDSEDDEFSLQTLPELHHINILGITEQLRTDHLNTEEKSELQRLITKYENAFYHPGDDLTFTNEIKHKIETGDHGPVYTKSYRYPAIHTEEVDRQMNEMLEQGIIKHSSSPYNSPIWVVPKKEDKVGNKEWRIVIDYRKLNAITEDDRYPIPVIDDILDKLGRANYFTTLDLTKGFYQIEVDPKDREKTAFSTTNGHYEFIRMPFGLKNAPATFQRMMNNVLREHINRICVVYMDDILVFSTSLQEHMENLGKVLKTLEVANLKVSLNKSDFLKKETEFLGHVVTNNGIKPNPNKIRCIKEFPIPKDVKEIQSFLGLTGYYRKFIPSYAKIAKPLTMRLKKDAIINTEDADYVQAFKKLQQILMSDMVLQYPDFEKSFTLTTDASNYALGAVLSQSNGPIAFASRTLNRHEINYSTVEKELLAIVWAVKQFRHYLYGRKFELRTDHKPLIWLANLKDPNSKLIRWKIRLNEYEFDIKHVEGKDNKVADALSRIREVNAITAKRKHKCEICNKMFSKKNLLRKHLDEHLKKRPPSPTSTIHSADEDGHNFFKISEKPLQHYKNQIKIDNSKDNKTTHERIFDRNRKIYAYETFDDELISRILNEAMENNLSALYCEDTEILLKLQEKYKTTKDNPLNTKQFEIILTTKFLQDVRYEELLEIINRHHRFENNHPGIDKTYIELKRKYYYPNMKKEIVKIINNCVICNFKIERNPVKLPFEKTETPHGPYVHYHLDIWYLNNQIFYLTMIDKFTKYAAMEELSDKTPLQAIKAVNKLFLIMKKPQKITMDNDPTFSNPVFTGHLEDNDIQYHFTTPHRHTGNSDIERFHSSLNENIRILKIREENNDVAYNYDLPLQALQAYNNSLHLSTKQKPIDLHFYNSDIHMEKVYNEIETAKEKMLKYRNKERKDEDINPKFGRTAIPHKTETKIKQLTTRKINDKKYKLDNRNTILHKDQFIKRKCLSRSLEVLAGDFLDDIPSGSAEARGSRFE